LLAHRLIPSDLGLVSICLATASTSAVLVEMGFGLSATRAMSADSGASAPQLFGAVCSARLLAIIGTLPIIGVILALAVNLEWTTVVVLAVITWGTSSCMGWTSLWYFQSHNRLVWIAGLEAVGILFGIFVLTLGADSLVSALLLNALIYAVPAIVAHLWLTRRLGSVQLSWNAAVAGWHMTRELAKFRMVASSYTTAIPIFLAIPLAPALVAPFFVAERVIRAFVAILIPFVQIAYPRMCALKLRDSERHRHRTIVLLGSVAITAALACGGLIALAPLIASLLSPKNLAPQVTRHIGALALIIVPIAITSVLGNLYMLPRGFDRLFNTIVLTTALIGSALLLTLPRTSLGAAGASWSIFAAEVSAAVLMIYFFIRDKGEN
jgi:O-antigen/teichoic acid export membrane protein